MKKITLLICMMFALISNAQISVQKTDGASVVTKLGLGYFINKGSTLIREKYTLNDANCPLQLNDVGIDAVYSDKYSFRPIGTFTTREPIVAYEVIHVLYNVFGEHIKTLSNTEITDIEGTQPFSKMVSWYASENNISDYYICVSYVANVRTKNGTLWHYDFKSIKEQLAKLKIGFEEGYLPKKDNEK